MHTVSHVVDAEAVQWYAGFRNGKSVRQRSIYGLQKVDVRHEYL